MGTELCEIVSNNFSRKDIIADGLFTSLLI